MLDAVKLAVIEKPYKAATLLAYGETASYKGYKLKQLLKGTNCFPTPDNKITVGFATKIDGKNPGHCEIINVTKFLPEIIEKLHEHYTNAYSNSSMFHLNVDKYFTDPILVIARQGNAIAPDRFDYLVRGNKRDNTISTPEIDSIAPIAESNMSRNSEKKYKNLCATRIYSNESSIEQKVHEKIYQIINK